MRRKKSFFLLFAALCFLPATLPARQDRSRYYEQLTGNLIQQMKNMQDENARLAEHIKIQAKKIAFLEEEYKRLAAENLVLKQSSAAGSESSRGQRQKLEGKLETLERKLQKLERLIRDVGREAARPGGSSKRYSRKGENTGKAAGENVEYVEHTVEKGHVLYNIARAYHVSVQDIRRINHLKSDRLSIGQKLLIPVKKGR